jgi:hypothetical protein
VPTDLGARRPFVIGLVVVALLAYAGLALFVESRGISGLAAAIVAWLLGRRHPRARFAAYIFLSAVGLRSVMTEHWATLAFAVILLGVLQIPSARRAWPRLTWRWSQRPLPGGNEHAADDRIGRP